MGPTNPPAATMGTANNQSSDARLLSLNAIDDLSVSVILSDDNLLTPLQLSIWTWYA